MVCDKVVCQRWCGERWCVTKLCVKDGVVKGGVRQSGVWRAHHRFDRGLCHKRSLGKQCRETKSIAHQVPKHAKTNQKDGVGCVVKDGV